MKVVVTTKNKKRPRQKINPTSINQGAATKSNQNKQNKGMYDNYDDEDNNDIVIVENLNEKEEKN